MSNMRTRLVRLGATALVFAVTFGVVAGYASAAVSTGSSGNTGVGVISGDTGNSGTVGTPKSLAGIKTRAKADITDRVNALQAAIAQVNAATGLGSGQSTLVSYLATDIAPLQALSEEIQADTTEKQAAHDFSTIFHTYRVDVLVIPAAGIAAEADRATSTAIPNLTKASSQAQALENPSNQNKLEPLIADLNAKISTATNATQGLTGAVLASTPAQWNTNHATLASSKSRASTAVTALQEGRADVSEILLNLRDSLGGETNGSGASSAGGGGSGLGNGLRGLRTTTTTP
jgi:hypothetical protein